MKKFFVILLMIVALTIIVAVIFGGFAVCKRGVYMKSLMRPMQPKSKEGAYAAHMVSLIDSLPENTPVVLTIHNDTLTVIIGRSINSAFLISKLKIFVKHSQRKIYLSAYEALAVKCCKPLSNGKKSFRPLTSDNSFTNIFQIKMSKYKVTELNLFEFYWRDPDKKITKLEITP
jgi:hypothetical protein